MLVNWVLGDRNKKMKINFPAYCTLFVFGLQNKAEYNFPSYYPKYFPKKPPKNTTKKQPTKKNP